MISWERQFSDVFKNINNLTKDKIYYDTSKLSQTSMFITFHPSWNRVWQEK